MRRWSLSLGLVSAVVLALLPAPGQATMNTSEWTAIQYLNKHRVGLGLTKLYYQHCLEAAAEDALQTGYAEVGSAVYQSVSALQAIGKRCGFSRVQQFGCGCLTPWAGAAVKAWTSSSQTRTKWGLPTHTSIGIARIPGDGSRETAWFVLVATPEAPPLP